MTHPRRILLLLYVIAVVQIAWYFPHMPAVLATHYDGAGEPNGWMSRSFALGFHLMLLGVTAAAFIGIPTIIGRVAPRRLNLPNKEFWLAPERRDASILSLKNRMAVLGCAAVVLMMIVTGMNFHANLERPARIPAPAIFGCIGGFLAFMAGWMISFYRRFGRRAAGQRT